MDNVPQPNRITLKANGPGLLTLSEITYPGWRVVVDGQEAEMKTIAGILRGVELLEGEHQVEFIFRPLSVYLGLGFFIVGLSLVFLAQRKTGLFSLFTRFPAP